MSNLISFSPFPILKTNRLILRAIDVTDMKMLFALQSNKKNRRYVESPCPENEEETLAFIKKIKKGIAEGKWIFWAIESKETSQFLGTICLWGFSKDFYTAEFGYELFPEHQRKGFMGEAFQEVERYAFENIGMKKLDAFTHRENVASSYLLEKFGYQINPERSEQLYQKSGQYMWIYEKKAKQLL